MSADHDGPEQLDDDDADDDLDDEFCIECGDAFHYDDIGGYNPPCACRLHCRSCHDAVVGARDDDEYERDEDDYPDTHDEAAQATERFWDGRVGQSSNDDDDLPF